MQPNCEAVCFIFARMSLSQLFIVVFFFFFKNRWVTPMSLLPVRTLDLSEPGFSKCWKVWEELKVDTTHKVWEGHIWGSYIYDSPI